MKKNTKTNKKSQFKKSTLPILIAFLVVLSVFAYKLLDQKVDDLTAEGPVNKEEIIDEGYVEIPEEEDIIPDIEMDHSHILTPALEEKELGQVESIIDYGEEGFVGAHYPVFDKESIDAMNKALITQYIEDFKKELASNSLKDKDHKYELSIDYKTFKGPNNTVSVIYNIVEDGFYLAHPRDEVVTKIYDLFNDKEIKLDDIMTLEDLKYISEFSLNYFSNSELYKDSMDSSIFYEGIEANFENYDNFILKEDKIIFIFDKYQIFSGNFGMPSVEITYLDLKEHVHTDLFQAFTKEDDLQEEVEVSEDALLEITLPERFIDPNKPMLALTFDDGPNKKVTTAILQALKEHDSVATFFVLGNRVSDNKDILKSMLEAGNEIGNHSYNHKELTKLTYDGLEEQINTTQNAVIKATGITPKFMRPTYGSYDSTLKENVGMPLILWSVDTLDWKNRNSKMVIDHVLEHVKDGDVILMHDIYESTADATKVLIPELIKRGYQLVTVSELFESRGEVLKDGHIYYRKHY